MDNIVRSNQFKAMKSEYRDRFIQLSEIFKQGCFKSTKNRHEPQHQDFELYKKKLSIQFQIQVCN